MNTDQQYPHFQEALLAQAIATGYMGASGNAQLKEAVMGYGGLARAQKRPMRNIGAKLDGMTGASPQSAPQKQKHQYQDAGQGIFSGGNLNPLNWGASAGDAERSALRMGSEVVGEDVIAPAVTKGIDPALKRVEEAGANVVKKGVGELQKQQPALQQLATDTATGSMKDIWNKHKGTILGAGGMGIGGLMLMMAMMNRQQPQQQQPMYAPYPPQGYPPTGGGAYRSF